ncbi:MAG: winged helix-turn-helix domain-containing protein [Methylococcales bacterium]|nr:winged helix-turn-helix domain-containing protein [Methylococcales bacterium]
MTSSNKTYNGSILCIGFNSERESTFNAYFTKKNYKIKFLAYDKSLDSDFMQNFDICFIYSNSDFNTIKNLIELKNKEIICLMNKIDFDCSLMLISENVMYCIEANTHCRDIELFIKKILTRSYVTQIDANWILDLEKGELLSPNKKSIALTKMETILLTSMINTDSNFINREELALKLNIDSNARSHLILNTTICRFRKKLADFDSSLKIKTWRKYGYSIEGPNISIKSSNNNCQNC